MAESPSVESAFGRAPMPLRSDIEAFEDQLDAAVERGNAEGLEIVGYGMASFAVTNWLLFPVHDVVQ